MSDTLTAIEPIAEGEELFNYCLWPYQPVASTRGKFHPSALLTHSFEFMGCEERGSALMEHLRSGIGRNRTVWGLKQIGGEITWEFYFYDYQRRQRERSITKVLAAIEPVYSCDIEPCEDLNYFMFSLDFPLHKPARSLEEIHVYIGNVGSVVSSGMSYSQTRKGRTMENFYFFFEARKHMDQVVGKISSSAHVTVPDFPTSAIIWPELAECHTICVANKKANDCIYFSGVNVNQLLFFMERLRYPEALMGFIRKHHSRLDHLLFDVGFDYTYDREGLHLLKSGYYGVF